MDEAEGSGPGATRGEAGNGTGEGRPPDALIRRVAERVRRARELKGIPRRVLSEKSGVSPRYLAQLEAGAGNISIGLLHRVAEALDNRVEWLVSEEDPWTSDAARIATLWRRAPEELREQVLSLLDPEPAGRQRAQRLCLIGLRGAGKSTLGRMAGARLGLPFVELNRVIESDSGMPVDEVMALYGQEGYRKLEARALAEVAERNERVILAVAGGIVSEPETYAYLRSRFHTIWVRTSPTEHMTRVRAQGDERPMAGNPEAMAQLREILASREALYEKAQAQLDTSGKTEEESLEDILALIAERGFLSA